MQMRCAGNEPRPISSVSVMRVPHFHARTQDEACMKSRLDLPRWDDSNRAEQSKAPWHLKIQHVNRRAGFDRECPEIRQVGRAEPEI